jgi:acyl transferase domain-containing protein/acyl carrier protein
MADQPGHDRRELVREALRRIDDLEARLEVARSALTAPIAITGIGCRYPGGVTDTASFWRLLAMGGDAITEVPADRWIAADWFDPDPAAPGKMSTRWGGFLDGIDALDAQFFGIAPREATMLDPQHRLVLEVAVEALESAGQPIDRLAESRTGIFIGMTTQEYQQHLMRTLPPDALSPYVVTGNVMNAAAGRLAYVLGARGPAIVVDTACSSSMTAIHLACQSLRAGDCDMALAGGVNLALDPRTSVMFTKWGMMAADGRCKTFDAAADGFVRSEGCGILVLKPLAAALAAGDHVMAVIEGSAINQDGGGGGLTVPNGVAQEALIRQALENAGVPPSAIDYVEAHGTGTKLGDPIELDALSSVFAPGRGQDSKLRIGSVKTNLGHTEAASGVAGVIKCVLALEHAEIPPQLHFTRPTPEIDWDRLPFEVVARPSPWPGGERRRRAGVSSFGFSGGNAHVVIAAPPEPVAAATPPEPDRLEILPLSARDPLALTMLARRYAAALLAPDAPPLADFCFSANTGRAPYAHRAFVCGRTHAALAESLSRLAEGDPDATATVGHVQGEAPKIAFLFTGQGSQYVGMGRELYDTQPVFRAEMDRCAALLIPHLDQPLLDLCFDPSVGDALLHQTRHTQPALFCLEWSLAQLWRSFGVAPTAMIGHSLGEYVAACQAGILSLEDGLRLVTARAALMQALAPDGMMAAVAADEATIRDFIAPHATSAAIAAVNGPRNIVISGKAGAVRQILDALEAAGISAMPLNVSHAFHSPAMDPMLDALEALIGGIALKPPDTVIVSNLTGQVAEGRDLVDPTYWRRHAREAVRFADGVDTLKMLGCRAFIEMGPSPVLINMARGGGGGEAGGDTRWLASMARGRDSRGLILEGLGALFIAGASIDWTALYRGEVRQRRVLPSYPFQRKRFWLDGPSTGAASLDTGGSTTLQRQADMAGSGRFTAAPRSPLVREIVFSGVMSVPSRPWLADHRVGGKVVVPMTAFVGMAFAAAREVLADNEVLADDDVALEDIVIAERAVLTGDEALAMQIVLSPESTEDHWMFRIISLAPGRGDGFVQHASGRAVRRQPGEITPVRVEDTPDMATLDGEVHLDAFRARGIAFGPAFRGVKRVRHRAGVALGEIDGGRSGVPMAGDGPFHPALLDVCLQPLVHAWPEDSLAAGFLPFAIERVEMLGVPTTAMTSPMSLTSHCVARESSNASGIMTGDIAIRDGDGAPRVLVKGLTVRAWSMARPGSEADGLLYEQVWRRVTDPSETESDTGALTTPASGTAPWLVFAAADEAEAVGAALRQRGHSGVTVRPGDYFEAIGPDAFAIRPSVRADYDRLLAEIARSGRSLGGVAHLWSLAAGLKPDADDIIEAQTLSTESLLHLSQSLAVRGGALNGGLWVVTRGARAIGPDVGTIDPVQAPALGFGKILGLEHPELGVRRVDLDPSSPSMAREAAELVKIMLAASGQAECALRGTRRYEPRLVRRTEHPPEPVRLVVTTPGQLDALAWQATSRRQPAAGEVEIKVEATGLNFRDVLSVLDMYGGGAQALGGEVSGTVVAVGPGVHDRAIGDAVAAFAFGGFSSFVTTHADLTIAKPEGWSFADIVTVPAAFATAYYALVECAGVVAGERVLIHAASGGVGLAAVQLARSLGCVIIATAGSPEKRDYLRALGIEHVFDSRSLSFAPAARAVAPGGIDVVVNTLAGDFNDASLELLGVNGRFVELGRRALWDPERAAAIRPSARYFGVDLASLARESPDRFRPFLAAAARAIARGELIPPPVRIFPADDVRDAFRFMAQARHIGKVIVTPPRGPTAKPSATPSGQGRFEARSDATYLITGGLSGLGLRTAEWLAGCGARHLVLIGRRPPDDSAKATIEGLEAAGVTVMALQTDIAVRQQVERVFGAIGDRLPPLRGIIHSAGVLDDGAIIQQSWPRIRDVLRPKIAGAWNLHTASRHLPLDFFICYSSASAILGSPGQAAHMAANSFLDALAHHRRAVGLAGLSINWGAWADIGAAASAEIIGQIARFGVEPMTPAEGLAALERLILDEAAQAMVADMRWDRFLATKRPKAEQAQFSGLARSPGGLAMPARDRVSDLAGPDSTGPESTGANLIGLNPSERRAAVEAMIRKALIGVLDLEPGAVIDPYKGLRDMGLDSLMSVDLRNRLQTLFDRALPATLAFNFPTFAALVDHMLDGFAEAGERPGTQATQAEARARDLEDILHLSADDAEALLLEELALTRELLS